MTSDLSAFYFDIRKDALYCDPPSSEKRKASLATIEQIFHCLTTWLAPILVFTAEEAWLSRYPDAASVHLELFPDVPSHWRDEALAKKWSDIRDIRAVVTGALELERAQKRSALRSKPRRLSISPIRNCALPWTAWISRKSASPPTSPSRPSARRQPRPSACPRRRRRCRLRAGAGREMRAVVALFRPGKRRSGLSRRDATRCAGLRELAQTGLWSRAGLDSHAARRTHGAPRLREIGVAAR